MTDIVLLEEDYADVKLTPEKTKQVIPHAKPDGEWTAPAQPDREFSSSPDGPSSEIALSLDFAEYQIKVRQNLLDALLALVVAEVNAVTTALGGEPGDALRTAAQAIRDLVSAKTRIFELTWKTRYQQDKGAYLYVTHSSDLHVDITHTGLEDKDRMSWTIESHVRLAQHDLKFTTAKKSGHKSFRGTLHGADVVYIPNKGAHPAEVVSSLELDCSGFKDELGTAIDTLLKAVEELLGLAAAAIKHIADWLKGKKDATQQEIDAESQRWRAEQADRLKADIKSTASSIASAMKKLIEEWKGDVSVYNHGVTIAAVKAETAKRILAELVKDAAGAQEKQDQRSSYLRRELIYSEPGELVPGERLFDAETWEELGLEPAAYAFRILRRSESGDVPTLVEELSANGEGAHVVANGRSEVALFPPSRPPLG